MNEFKRMQKLAGLVTESQLNEAKILREGDDWEKLTIDDVKTAFPDKTFADGGKVDDSYKQSDSIVIPDVNTAVEILEYLDKKMYPYGIGGDPKEITKVWNRFPKSTVKMALPRFINERYATIISFVFDDGSQYPPVFTYHGNHIGSPLIWQRQGNASWQDWSDNEPRKSAGDFDKFFAQYNKESPGKEMNESSLNEADLENYMFFSNLKQMKRQIEMMMEMDPAMVDSILQNGHDWADDHISEAKTNMDQVFDFLKNEMDGKYALNEAEEVYGGQSVDRGATGSSIEFTIIDNTPEYYTIDYKITPNSRYSSKTASRYNVREPKTGRQRIQKNPDDVQKEWIRVSGDDFLIGKSFAKEIYPEEN